MWLNNIILLLMWCNQNRLLLITDVTTVSTTLSHDTNECIFLYSVHEVAARTALTSGFSAEER